MAPIRCTCATKAGNPCQAWAVAGTVPPTCAAHLPRTEPPPTVHGFYSSAVHPDELAALVQYSDDMTLDDEIAVARVALRRALAALSAPKDGEQGRLVALADFGRLAAVVFAGTSTVARLLRARRALSGDAADGIAGALAQALDELSTEWERPL